VAEERWAGRAVAAPLFAATTRYVVPAGTAGNTPTSPYTSWETAANDLALAIDAAAALDTILVAPGTYSIGSTLDIACATSGFVTPHAAFPQGPSESALPITLT